MRFYASRNKQKGFTLVEVTVTVAIVGILASLVLVSIQSIRQSSRDKQRISDLAQLQFALRLYNDIHGTYRVAGSGSGGNGTGWVSYEGGGGYARSVARALYEEGFLPTANFHDPSVSLNVAGGYMIYLCDGGKSYSLSATKEIPIQSEIDYAKTVCNSDTTQASLPGNSIVARYGKNYAVGNKTY